MARNWAASGGDTGIRDELGPRMAALDGRPPARAGRVGHATAQPELPNPRRTARAVPARSLRGVRAIHEQARPEGAVTMRERSLRDPCAILRSVRRRPRARAEAQDSRNGVIRQSAAKTASQDRAGTTIGGRRECGAGRIRRRGSWTPGGPTAPAL